MKGADNLYPLTFKPVYKDYIWGGSRIPVLYGRNEPEGVYAESWEVSTRPEGMSVVANGHLAGQTLGELVERFGSDLVGDACKNGVFPLLIKIIDSAQNLSVQVHPDDDSAPIVGGEAKTEMWYVLDAEPDAVVYAGLKPGTDSDTVRQAVKDGKLADHLISHSVVKGDVIFVPGGRVHAIGAGCLLLEVQQNSNTTYRLYDWNRVGPDGSPRELHMEKALQVIRWADTENAKIVDTPPRRIDLQKGNTVLSLLKTEYFQIEKYVLQTWCECEGLASSFEVLFVEEGNISIEIREEVVLEAGAGVSILIPACMREYRIHADSRASVIVASLSSIV